MITIKLTTDPWAKKAGFRYELTDEDEIHYFSTYEEIGDYFHIKNEHTTSGFGVLTPEIIEGIINKYKQP
jgi:hypothetical protein